MAKLVNLAHGRLVDSRQERLPAPFSGLAGFNAEILVLARDMQRAIRQVEVLRFGQLHVLLGRRADYDVGFARFGVEPELPAAGILAHNV